MPKVKKGESREDYVNRCVPVLISEGKDKEEAIAICSSMYREHNMDGKELGNKLIRACNSNFQFKEELTSGEKIYTGLVATTVPDRVFDILSVNALEQIRDRINMESKAGDIHGSYRAISVSHDWIKQNNPELDMAAMMLPTARVVDLDGGHKGVEVDLKINKYYKGEISPEELEYRIDEGYFAGLSIEYDVDNTECKSVYLDGSEYRFIDNILEFGGAGFARPRLIANPTAVLYKEIETEIDKMAKKKIEDKLEAKESLEEVVEETIESEPQSETEQTSEVKEEVVVEEKTEEVSQESEPQVEEAKQVEEESKVEEVAVDAPEKVEAQVKEVKTSEEKKVLSTKEIEELLQSKEIREEIEKHLNVKTKVLNTKEEKMDNIPLSVKEMNDVISANEFNSFQYKEAASRYFSEHESDISLAMKTTGIPLNTTMQVKCDGTKLRVVGNLQTKDTLDTGSNTTTYGQSSVEFADVYVPGIVDTFNNATNLFGQIQKRDHMEGGNYYGWRIKTAQKSSLSVDPDDNSISKDYMSKLKLRTDIKEYRIGVSVSDYTLHHSRASMGDLFRIEVESATRDLLKDINKDLFTEQADGDGTKILGLEAVADSAGNTTLYGLTRSAANRLAPDTATDTYQAIGGALTTAKMREAVTAVEVEGANRGDLRIIVNPSQRDNLFELEDGNQRYGVKPQLGFEGVVSYDGVPLIVDPDCQSDALFVVDYSSYYIVMSRAPQLIGLAKVGAAEEAYVSTYLAVVYEQPRRIHMLDTLS